MSKSLDDVLIVIDGKPITMRGIINSFQEYQTPSGEHREGNETRKAVLPSREDMIDILALYMANHSPTQPLYSAHFEELRIMGDQQLIAVYRKVFPD